MGRDARDRIRNIVVMGIHTFAWSSANRGLAVPQRRLFLQLTSRSGAIWACNEPDDEERIVGTAVDFCRVVTQTRNAADTALALRGGVAEECM